jgi:cobalamin biosynthesis protein CobT
MHSCINSKRVKFPYQIIEDNTEEDNRDDETVEEAAEEDTSDTEETDEEATEESTNRDDETVEEAAEEDTNETEETEEEAIKESASDTRARGRASIPPASRSRASRTLNPTERLIEQMQARAEASGITAADLQYMQQMIEDDVQADIMGVGAGVGGGFTNTAELHVLNYKQTMESEDREEWKKELSCKENFLMEKRYRYIEVPQEWEEYYDDRVFC